VQGSVFGAVCDFFRFKLFMYWYEISPELLNGFAPNSQGRPVWSLAGTSLNVKVKGQGHRGQKTGFLADISEIAELICNKFTGKTCFIPHSDEFEGKRSRSPGTKTTFYFTALLVAFVRFMFGKTSLASSLFLFVYEMLPELLNGFAPYSQGGRDVFGPSLIRV